MKLRGERESQTVEHAPAAADGEPRLGAAPERHGQLAAAAAAEPHQPTAHVLRQRAVPQLADPADALLLLCRRRHLRVVGNVDRHTRHDILARPFPTPIPGGDHHGTSAASPSSSARVLRKKVLVVRRRSGELLIASIGALIEVDWTRSMYAVDAKAAGQGRCQRWRW
jgi:hypothetical protein